MTAVRNRHPFPKSDRLLKRHEFKRVSREGTRLVGTLLCVDRARLQDPNEPTKLGISASTRFGSAPQRNRFKRLVREAFRLDKTKIPPGYALNVVPRGWAKTASLSKIQEDLYRLISWPLSS